MSKKAQYKNFSTIFDRSNDTRSYRPENQAAEKEQNKRLSK